MSILLIFPPFADPGKQYLAMPTLLAYLRSRNVPVTVLDANNEFYFRFLTPTRVSHAREFAEERFQVLNGKPELHFREATEFLRIVRTMNVSQGLEHSLKKAMESDTHTSVTEKRQAVANAVSLCSLPFFPETIDLARYLQYSSALSEYSSQDILRSVEQPGVYSDILREMIRQALAHRNYKIVGISVCFPSQVFPAFFCAHLIRQMDPSIHVTMGGSFVSTHIRNLEEPRLFRLADSFVIDDGEIPLERLNEELSSPCPRMNQVPGLIYLSEGKIVRNALPPFIDMELLPVPDYSFVSESCHVLSGGRLSPVLFRLSRGCHWARCAFCQTKLPAVQHYQRLPSDVVYQQLCAVMEQTHSGIFQFVDDSAPPDSLEALCRKITEHRPEIKWIANLRFDPSLTLERCMVFRDGGCLSLNLGIESYNDRLLRLMDKGINLRLIDRVLSNMKWTGLKVVALMMVGFPTETEEEALEGFSKIRHLVEEDFLLSYYYNYFKIFPFSSVFQYPDRFGITKIVYPEGQDLNPLIFEFESSGMERGKAFQLSRLFNETRPFSHDAEELCLTDITELPIKGKPIPIHYDMKALYSMIHNVGKPFGVYPSEPVVQRI